MGDMVWNVDSVDGGVREGEGDGGEQGDKSVC